MFRSVLRYLLVAFAIGVSVPPAIAQTWNAVTGTWNTPANWVGGVVPLSSATTALVFNASGSTSYTATNNIGAGTFTLNSLTVNNTGSGTITLNGTAVANTYTFAGTAPTIDVQAGTVLFNGLMAGSPTVTKTGVGTFIHDSNNGAFTGTLNVNAGTFINRATTVANTNFNPVSIVVNNGGTYQFGAAGVGDPNLPNSTYITVNAGGTVNWQEGETFGGVNLQGGLIDLQQGGMTSSGTTAQSWTSGTLTGSGTNAVGGSTAINKTTSGTVIITGSARVTTSTGGFNIEDGTVTHVNAANLGTANITLGAAATAGTFEYQGISALRAGNFTTNAGGGTISVTNANTDLTISGNIGGTGPLAKTGAGSLTFTGTLSSTGLTSVTAGTLRVNPITAAGGFLVSDGATLAVNSGAGSASFATPALALGTAASNIRFELNTATVPTSPLLIVSNVDGLTSGGATLSLTNLQAFANGTYTLIDYNGGNITSGFNLALPGRTAGSLVYNTANTSVDVSITGSDSIVYGGQISGVWDAGTAANVGGTNNFKLVSNGNSTNFIDTDTVTFDDTAVGNFTVNLAANVQPGSVLVNNTTNVYKFEGTGAISGTTGLSKQGTGTLILANANTYSGGTTVTAGTLQIGDGGTVGSISGGITLGTAAILAFSRSDSVTFANAITPTGNATITNNGAGAITLGSAIALAANNLEVTGSGNINFGAAISGTGTITKNGTGTSTLLANNNPFTGTVVINAGTLLLNDAGVGGGDLSATSIIVNNGGTFQFAVFPTTGNTDLPDATYITLNAGGNVIWNEGENFGGLNFNGGTLTMRANTTLVGATPSDWRSGTIIAVPTTTATINGSTAITKTTSGTIAIDGVILGNTGGLNIEDGVIATNAAISGTAGNITLGVNSGSTQGTLRLTNTDTTTTLTIARPLALNETGGTIDVTTAGKNYLFSGVASGFAPLTKSGAGTLTLTANNSLSGSVTVSGGVLLANGQTGINSGTGTATVSVDNGGTLGGNGRVAGPITVTSGGTIRGDSGTGTGTLTAGNVTIASNGQLAANIAATGTSSNLALGTNTLNLVTGAKVNLTGLAGFTNATPSSYNLANFTSGSTLQLNGMNVADGFVFGNYTEGTGPLGAVTIDVANLGVTLNTGDQFVLSRSGDALVLNFTPVPEPATVLALSAGIVGVVGLVRRRRNRNANI